MPTKNTKHLLSVFFCMMGSVCTGPAIGQEELDLGVPVGEGGGLFEQDTAQDEGLPKGQTVEVGSFGQIDLHVKDLELTKVLQLLSIQSQRNIVASRNVAGTVSADLYGVDFYEALDAILATNGFGYQEKGNFIYVYTAAELAELEEAQRKLSHKIVRLNYMPAADAAAFVTPLLSSGGSIAVSGEAEDGFEPSIGDGGADSYAESPTLIIRDYPENIEEILGVIKELDIRPKQVLVEATILQARLDEDNAFGVDFSIFTDLNISDFVNPLSAVDELITGVPGDSGQVIQSNVGNVATQNGGVKIGISNKDAAIFVSALDNVSDTTVLSTPNILVLNRQRADLLVGQRLGFVSTTQTEGSTTQNVEFLDVGTQLTVRPFVSDDDYIRMELRPSVSDGEVDTTTNTNFTIPNETTQELQTNVIVKSGQTVVLGGLFSENTSTGRNQVPGVADLPLIGNAFKGQTDQLRRNEVIFLIKPTVMKDQSLYDGADTAMDSIEKARLGAREGLLPWSRSKLTASHVHQALKHLDAGDTEQALWNVNLALHIEPTMVDALRLKERITGETLYYYDRSMLRGVIDTMVDEEVGKLDLPKDAPDGLGENPAGPDRPQAPGAGIEPGGDAAAAMGPVEAWTDQPSEPLAPDFDADPAPGAAADAAPAPGFEHFGRFEDHPVSWGDAEPAGGSAAADAAQADDTASAQPADTLDQLTADGFSPEPAGGQPLASESLAEPDFAALEAPPAPAGAVEAQGGEAGVPRGGMLGGSGFTQAEPAENAQGAAPQPPADSFEFAKDDEWVQVTPGPGSDAPVNIFDFWSDAESAQLAEIAAEAEQGLDGESAESRGAVTEVDPATVDGPGN